MELEPEATIHSPEHYWLDHITQCQEQNLSLAEYAKVHKLRAGKLYYWKKRLKTLGWLQPDQTQVAFSRVQPSTLGSYSSGSRLRFPNGMIVEWDTPLEGDLLTQLLPLVNHLP